MARETVSAVMFSIATASGHPVNRSTIVKQKDFPSDDGKGPIKPHECVKILHQVRRKCPEVSSCVCALLNVDKQYNSDPIFHCFPHVWPNISDAMSWKDAGNTRYMAFSEFLSEETEQALPQLASPPTRSNALRQLSNVTQAYSCKNGLLHAVGRCC
ncbi:hypothetical protein TNCV_4402411 [Trichonephila clavipes]|nr:hypothetical protein TNCV_4402411 [Trichonephila clavipes]